MALAPRRIATLTSIRTIEQCSYPSVDLDLANGSHL